MENHHMREQILHGRCRRSFTLVLICAGFCTLINSHRDDKFLSQIYDLLPESNKFSMHLSQMFYQSDSMSLERLRSSIISNVFLSLTDVHILPAFSRVNCVYGSTYLMYFLISLSSALEYYT